MDGALSAGETAQIHQAFRMAWDEVLFRTHDPMGAQEELMEILDQAERRGDGLLARAAFHRGLDLGLDTLVDSYLAARPKEAKALERYKAALEKANQAKSFEYLLGSAFTEQQLGR